MIVQIDGGSFVNSGSGATTTSNAIACEYASSIVVTVRNTNASNATQGTTMEQSFDGGTSWTALDTTFFEALTGINLASIPANGRAKAIVHLKTATPNLSGRGVFPCTHVRFKTVGNATAATVTNIAITAAVIYDDRGPSLL